MPPADFPEDLPDEDFASNDSEASYGAGPLNWRAMIEGAGLTGPIRMLATQSEVLSLTDEAVRLKLSVRAFATEPNRRRLSEELTRYLGRHFAVEFEVGAVAEDLTVAAAERRERIEAHLALVDAFSKDPFVKSVAEIFRGVVDEGSVRPIEADAKAKAAPKGRR